MTVQHNNPEKFGPNWMFWETSVAIAHAKITEAELADGVLLGAGINHGRLFRISSGGDMALPTEHVRLGLVPQSQGQILEGIVKFVMRVPLLPPESIPQEFLATYVFSEPGHNREPLEDVPTTDIFIEAYKADHEVMRFHITPNGARAYADAGDIYDADFTSIDKTGQFFDVRPNLETMALQMDADANWPDMQSFDQLLRTYDIFQQETIGPNRNIAS